MPKDKNFDVKVSYDGGFEAICMDKVADEAEAIIEAMKMIRRKRRKNGDYRKIIAVWVFPVEEDEHPLRT